MLPFDPLQPTVRLSGEINRAMADHFWQTISKLPTQDGDGALVVMLTTSGGDADIGREIAQDIKLWQHKTSKPIYFLGKTLVYSAGTTIMAAFEKSRRYLTADCSLLLHERKLTLTLDFKDSLRLVQAKAHGLLAHCEHGIKIENEIFESLAQDSVMSAQALIEKARGEWYFDAKEAVACGLAHAIIADQRFQKISK